jgi:hypothetical protein
VEGNRPDRKIEGARRVPPDIQIRELLATFKKLSKSRNTPTRPSAQRLQCIEGSNGEEAKRS